MDEGMAKKAVRRVRLEDGGGNSVPTVPEVVKVMKKLKALREDNELSLAPKRTPLFREYSQQYPDYSWCSWFIASKESRMGTDSFIHDHSGRCWQTYARNPAQSYLQPQVDHTRQLCKVCREE